MIEKIIMHRLEKNQTIMILNIKLSIALTLIAALVRSEMTLCS
jgi:hypothetical protein